MENSTRALAMGESWFGTGVSSDNLMCINLGHGIGSAIISDGEFFRGSSGSSGEFGHITMEKNGPVCACGNRGCLESLASGYAIAQAAKVCVQNGGGAFILEQANGNVECIEAKTVFDAARQGDKDAKDIISRAAEYIGIALAGCINLLDPDMIIFAGRVSLAGDLFIHPIQEVAKKRQMKYAGRKVRFETARLGLDATAIGAATLVIKKFIEQGASMI
jgi:predicted NBD/HSP70 family sugar kinase